MDFSDPSRLRRTLRPFRAKLKAFHETCKISPLSASVDFKPTSPLFGSKVKVTYRRFRSNNSCRDGGNNGSNDAVYTADALMAANLANPLRGHESMCESTMFLPSPMRKITQSLQDTWNDLVEKTWSDYWSSLYPLKERRTSGNHGNCAKIILPAGCRIQLNNSKIDYRFRIPAPTDPAGIAKYSGSSVPTVLPLSVLAAIAFARNITKDIIPAANRIGEETEDRKAQFEERMYSKVPHHLRRFALLGHSFYSLTSLRYFLPGPCLPPLINICVQRTLLDPGWHLLNLYMDRSYPTYSSDWETLKAYAMGLHRELLWMQTLAINVSFVKLQAKDGRLGGFRKFLQICWDQGVKQSRYDTLSEVARISRNLIKQTVCYFARLTLSSTVDDNYFAESIADAGIEAQLLTRDLTSYLTDHHLVFEDDATTRSILDVADLICDHFELLHGRKMLSPLIPFVFHCAFISYERFPLARDRYFSILAYSTCVPEILAPFSTRQIHHYAVQLAQQEEHEYAVTFWHFLAEDLVDGDGDLTLRKPLALRDMSDKDLLKNVKTCKRLFKDKLIKQQPDWSYKPYPQTEEDFVSMISSTPVVTRTLEMTTDVLSQMLPSQGTTPCPSTIRKLRRLKKQSLLVDKSNYQTPISQPRKRLSDLDEQYRSSAKRVRWLNVGCGGENDLYRQTDFSDCTSVVSDAEKSHAPLLRRQFDPRGYEAHPGEATYSGHVGSDDMFVEVNYDQYDVDDHQQDHVDETSSAAPIAVTDVDYSEDGKENVDGLLNFESVVAKDFEPPRRALGPSWDKESNVRFQVATDEGLMDNFELMSGAGPLSSSDTIGLNQQETPRPLTDPQVDQESDYADDLTDRLYESSSSYGSTPRAKPARSKSQTKVLKRVNINLLASPRKEKRPSSSTVIHEDSDGYLSF